MKSIPLLIVFIGYILIRDSSGASLDAAQEKFITALNQGRRLLAKNENISNMHELIWNSSLQDALSSKTSDEMNNSSEWYLWWIKRGNLSSNFKLCNDCVIRGQNRSISKNRKLFFPRQRTIACAEKDDFFVCLLGPSRLPKDIVDGPPGTNCRDGFKNNNNGLCSAEKQKDLRVSIPSSSNSNQRVLPEVKHDPKEEKLIVELNEMRRAIAKNMSIPNMHELSWSHKLQVEVNTLSLENIVETWDFELFKKPSFSTGIDGIILVCFHGNIITCGAFHPTKTTVACAMRNFKAGKFVCLLGPGPRKKEEALIKGQPGTKCQDGFKINSDGLCSASDPKNLTLPEVKLDPEQASFIVNLNEIRRAMAKKQRAANMHELTWSRKLQVDANTLPLNNMPWKHNTMDQLSIEASIGTILKSSCVSNNEMKCPLFYPDETTIACAKRNDGTRERFICLVGSSKDETTFVLVTGTPGTQCKDGFKNNNDGLCSDKPIPLSAKWKMEPKKFISDLNDLRRKLAIEKKISNMHELTWDEKMQAKLDSLKPGDLDKFKDSNQYRVVFGSFEKNQTEHSKECIAKTNSEENCAYIYPRQKTVACVSKPPNIICYFGPEKYQVRFEKGNSGEKCDPGFENDLNGLCTVMAPKPTTPSKAPATSTSLPPAPQRTTADPKPTNSSASVVTSRAPEVPISRAPEILTSSKAPPAPTRKPPSLITRPVPTLPAELRDYEEMDGDEYDDDFPTDEPMKISGRSFELFFLVLIMVVLNA